MTVPNDATATPEDAAPQAQVATDNAPAAATETESLSLEEAKKLRNEAQNLRRRLKAYEEAEETAKQAAMSEQEKLQQRASQAEQERERLLTDLRSERAANAIALAAAKVGLPADLAARLVSVEFDEHGKPVKVDEAVRALAAQYPQLVATPGAAAGGSPMNPAANGRGANVYTTSQIADRAFWKANEADIMKAMREGRIVEG